MRVQAPENESLEFALVALNRDGNAVALFLEPPYLQVQVEPQIEVEMKPVAVGWECEVASAEADLHTFDSLPLVVLKSH